MQYDILRGTIVLNNSGTTFYDTVPNISVIFLRFSVTLIPASVQISVYPERLYGIPNFYRESIACNIGQNEVSNHTSEVIHVF